MATAKVINPPSVRIQLEISEEEAAFLLSVLGSVGGPPERARGKADGIARGLYDVVANIPRIDTLRREYSNGKTGSIFFK